MVGTKHFRRRAAQRGLRPEVFHSVLAFGTPVERAGARFFTVHARDVPPDLDHRIVERALGWVIVVGDDGEPLTCYRRADAPRYIRRKSKLDRRSGRLRAPPGRAQGEFLLAG